MPLSLLSKTNAVRLSLTIIGLGIGLSLFSSQILAASPTPSPTPKTAVKASPTPSASPTENATSAGQTTSKLRERIERIVEEKRDQIAGVLDDISGQRRGFIGEVQRVSSETITIKTNKATHILPLTPEVSLAKAGKKITIDAVAVGDWAIVIGSLKDDQLVAERILISSTSLRPKNQLVVLGTIKEINKTTLTVSSRKQNQDHTVNLVKTTVFQDMQGEPIKATQITDEVQALVIGVANDDEFDARIIRLLGPLPSVSASPKASATTSKVSPRPSPSVTPKP